ncbi:hypothetical protein [Halococcoides cellulosivorans]|uniref:Bax inhibitor-1/YccA family protein n=1 Tax=Halococcoides cellulosivorans TaxID=1679096 RepID=A0A2R4X2M7_9EURY|nr:hypothetical protein [Halococcoides cellulosivorans]AWB28051.1 hypothetical protein HARCEL1_10195 [Halococcoides cellulosivorans]
MGTNVRHGTIEGAATVDRSIGRIVGIASALVVFNILLMWLVSFTPIAPLVTPLLFANYFVTIGFFVVTVGGGFWIANLGLERGSGILTGAGVTLTQAGYGLFGAAILAIAGSQLGLSASMRLAGIGIAALITAAITAVVTVIVFSTDHSFERWQTYAFGGFIGGMALGAVGYFVNPMLIALAGVIFFLAFVCDLTYEIWAVREDYHASDLRSAIGIYVAVMGVFIHVLQWVLRILALLDN